MAVKLRWLVLLAGLMLVVAACGDSSELEDARSRISELESTNSALQSTNSSLESEVATLEADVATHEADASALEAEKASLESDNETLASDKAALEATLASTGQTLILQADIVGEGCMLQNSYLNDGEAKATFRVRVYDPVNGEQLGDEALESVVVSLSDGQDFELHWGPHPPGTEDDFFWTYGWEIFAGYPAGNIPYTITATAIDGRTGDFEPFMVAPSLLTVVDAAA